MKNDSLTAQILNLATIVEKALVKIEECLDKQNERILELEKALFVRQSDCQSEEQWDEEHNEWDWDDTISIPEEELP